MSVTKKSTVRTLERLAGEILGFPVLPRGFAALVWVLRRLGVLRQRTPARPDQPIRRIFVAHPYSSVGDLILLIPLLEELHAAWPRASVDVAVGAPVAELLTGLPDLTIIPVAHSDFLRSSAGRTFRSWWRLLERYQATLHFLRLARLQLMRREYDLAVAPRWGGIGIWPAVYLAYLSGAPTVIGYSASVDGGHAATDRLLTTAAHGGAHEHESVRNLALLTRAGVLESIPDLATVVDRPIPSLLALASRTPALPTAEPYAVIAPGANAPFRKWSPQNLTVVMQELHRNIGLHFCLVGGSADVPLCQAFAASLPGCATSRAGQTGLSQMVSLLAEARLFIGMDSGIAHIAGALGVPTIVISPFPSSSTVDHFNSPVRFRPCGPRVRVLQPLYPLPPCNPTCSAPDSHCILQITPQDVIRVASELMQTAAVKRPGALA